jgi:hypothetical protein
LHFEIEFSLKFSYSQKRCFVKGYLVNIYSDFNVLDVVNGFLNGFKSINILKSLFQVGIINRRDLISELGVFPFNQLHYNLKVCRNLFQVQTLLILKYFLNSSKVRYCGINFLNLFLNFFLQFLFLFLPDGEGWTKLHNANRSASLP